MDDLADIDALWSLVFPEDLRRIVDLARRLFAAPALLLSPEGDGERLRFPADTGGTAAAEAGLGAPLVPDAGPHAGRRLGTLRVVGDRDWTDEDRAALGDLAGCLSSLLASRAADVRRDDPLPAPPPVFVTGGEDDVPATPPEGSIHILLADDLDLNRKLISDMLAIEGHAVDSVADGAAAVKAAGEHSYDIILMDMIMPGMDGMAATRAIRAMPAPACDVPIVALTAHSLPEQLDNCLKAGVDAILTKPMSVAALTDAVSTWTRRGRHAA